MFYIRTILHPTDFSESSDAAFQVACSMARDHGARLVVVHIVVPTMMGYPEGVLVPEPEPDLTLVKEKLDRFATLAPDLKVETRMVEGDPAAEILKTATEVECDVIVIGTHGRRGVSRFVLGSVAENVARRAACPVMTVKAPETHHESAPVAAVPIGTEEFFLR